MIIIIIIISSYCVIVLSKRQSPKTVLFRSTLTRTITQYELLILLASNHLFGILHHLVFLRRN